MQPKITEGLLCTRHWARHHLRTWSNTLLLPAPCPFPAPSQFLCKPFMDRSSQVPQKICFSGKNINVSTILTKIHFQFNSCNSIWGFHEGSFYREQFMILSKTQYWKNTSFFFRKKRCCKFAEILMVMCYFLIPNQNIFLLRILNLRGTTTYSEGNNIKKILFITFLWIPSLRNILFSYLYTFSGPLTSF